MPVIEFSNVSKTYPQAAAPAVREVSFQVSPGEFVCMVGSSGCGKTTTLKMIAGLEAPSVGSIKKPPEISMAFQSGALFPWLSVFDNIAFGLRQKGASAEHVSRTVDKELRAMDIWELRHEYPSELSGGQRQRVGIARALAVEPSVLLLDEPFSALDPKTTAELHDDIIQVWEERKMTVVMVSHVIEEAVSLAGRVILMKDGTIDQVFSIELPYPRRESEHFHREVMKIRREFFR